MTKSGESSRGAHRASRISAASKHGLRVFGGFFAAAVLFFVVTFGPYKSVSGSRELPMPEWIMLLPTLIALGAGVITALIVMVVDLVRDRPLTRE